MVKLALVRWTDAHVPAGSWVHVDDIKDDGYYYVNSIGYVMEAAHGAKKNHVSLVTSWGQDDYIDGILHIPSKMVKQIIYLQEEVMSVTKREVDSTIHYLSRVTPRGVDDQDRLVKLIDRLSAVASSLEQSTNKLDTFMHGQQR